MTDAVMAQLSAQGYQPVFLPTDSHGFRPPDLYVYDGARRVLERWGPLKDFEPAVGKLVAKKASGPNTGTEVTRAMSGNIALRFFGRIMRMLGLGDGEVSGSFGFSDSARFRYEFDGISALYVDRSKLQPLIARTSFGGWVDSQISQGNVHVALEYLYAQRIRLREANGKEFEAGAKAELDKLVETNVSGTVKREKTGYLTFEAEGGGAAFAYKAMQVFRFDGELVIGGHARKLGNEAEARDPDRDFSAPRAPGVFLDVEPGRSRP